MIDIHAVLAGLASHRPVFHSEADLQHAFAWELRGHYPDAVVRLERPVQTSIGLLHLDLLVQVAGVGLAFELKYKTRALVARVRDEVFSLQDHGAQPPGRYDFLKDVARLEALAPAMPNSSSWAILVTNDSAYWSEPRGGEGTSAAFSLSDGRLCTGVLTWGAATGPGTKRGREAPLDLAGRYVFRWNDYSSIEGPLHGQGRFRYLTVPVAPTGQRGAA